MDKVDLKRTALLNIDMQHFFVVGAPEGLTIIERINRLISVCDQRGIPVFHTTNVFRPDVANVEEAVALHKNLRVNPDHIIFEKRHFGAFHESSLEEQMHRRGINTIIITGIRTNVCCSTTAWEAISRGFKVFFLSDATATKEMGGVSAEILQTATCATLNHLFGNVVSTAEMIGMIEAAASVLA